MPINPPRPAIYKDGQWWQVPIKDDIDALQAQIDTITGVAFDSKYQIVQDEGSPLTARHKLDFVGPGVVAADDSGNDRTTVTVDPFYQTVQDEGSPLTQRRKLDFAGSGVTATDDSGNDRTIVTIPGASGGPGTEYDYVERTSTFTITTGSSDATAEAVIDGNAVTYDGSTRICIEFYACFIGISVNNTLAVNLYDGSTDLGRILTVAAGNATSGSWTSGQFAKRYLTPSAASHTYHIKAWKTGGTAQIGAGAGGTATTMPAFMRISKA